VREQFICHVTEVFRLTVEYLWKKSCARARKHHGILLDVSPGEFDTKGASFGSVFTDEDDPKCVFLFYSGAQNSQMLHSTIGLAI